MPDYRCPLGRICQCDPDGESEKSRPCKLARRIAALVRSALDESSNDEEMNRNATLNAIDQLRAVLRSEGLDLGSIIEHNHYSTADAQQIFDRGIKKGRNEEVQKQAAPPEY